MFLGGGSGAHALDGALLDRGPRQQAKIHLNSAQRIKRQMIAMTMVTGMAIRRLLSYHPWKTSCQLPSLQLPFSHLPA